VRQSSKGQKKLRKKQILYGAVALFLVAGLVLSAVLGFVDFLTGGQGANKDPSILKLEEEIATLEKSLKKDVENGLLAAEIGTLYYDMATISWQQGLQKQGNKYGEKSRKYLIQAVENGEISPEITLDIAFLAFSLEDYDTAEEYFQKTIDQGEQNPIAHIYYGLYLSNLEREKEAIEHFAKALEYAPEDSPEAQAAEYYLSLLQETGS
jgi:tetratricopeptide (TPR) repeat protein